MPRRRQPAPQQPQGTQEGAHWNPWGSPPPGLFDRNGRLRPGALTSEQALREQDERSAWFRELDQEVNGHSR